MASAPSVSWNSPSITHLASSQNPSSPMNSSDEAFVCVALRYLMIWQKLSLAVLVLVAVQGVTAPAFSQVAIGETSDNREIGHEPNGHLFRGWEGERMRLQERGVTFDFQYISDTLANLKSERRERLTNWNRVRGTMDINL